MATTADHDRSATGPPATGTAGDRVGRLERCAAALEERVAEHRRAGRPVPPALGQALAGFREDLAIARHEAGEG